MPTAAGATFAAPATPTAGPVESLAARVASLESEVAELKAAVAALMKTRASDPSRLRTGIDASEPPVV